MTESEIITILDLSNSALDTHIEFWLSGSFAILMAFFFAGDKIVGFVRWTLMFLYLTATVFFSIRISLDLVRIVESLRLLGEIGSSYEATFFGLGVFSGLVLGTLILGGTAATVYFGVNSEKILSRDQ